MKKAFTLVELLVVVVVIITLMSVAFRLGGAGSGQDARARTVNRLQRLENCLSGYYAAYGSYPPVAVHGSRDYTYEANEQGIQMIDRDNEKHWTERFELNEIEKNKIVKRSVEAACRSQPVGMSYPFANKDIEKYVEAVSKILMAKANSNKKENKKFADNPKLKAGFTALTENSLVSGRQSDSDWAHSQVFKFGMMSYLLPRLLVIFNIDPKSGSINSGFKAFFSKQAQWLANNEIPCDFETGQPYASWDDVLEEMRENPWKIEVLPSQSVCARWMPNLEGVVSGLDREFFGVKVHYSGDGNTAGGVSADTYDPPLYSANGDAQSQGNYSQQYVLDGLTVNDGWGNEFYYYSPSPHQTYILWSAGANGMTFPPWVPAEDLKSMSATDRATVEKLIADDIVHMKN